MSDQPVFSAQQLAQQAVTAQRTQSAADVAPETASEPKRGPGRPRKLLNAVPPIPPPTIEDKAQSEWERLERVARAKRLGVPVESLVAIAEPVEDWQTDLIEAKAPADPAFAGLYRVLWSSICMPGGGIARPGRNVRLNAEDGRTVTELGIAERVKGK